MNLRNLRKASTACAFGTFLRTWSLPPRAGTLTCMDSTNFGLVCGTTKGFWATIPIESNVPARLSPLSEGQELLHIHAQGVFVAGSFFDTVLEKYVVRIADQTRQYAPHTTYHPTHVLGGGFVRVNMDLCYFSLSIDGLYVVSSARRGTIVRIGMLQDIIGNTPVSVSVTEDGMAFVATLDGGLYLVNIEAGTLNSWTKAAFIPRAVDSIRLRGVRAEYTLAWTSVFGDVVTGHATRRILGQRAGNITTTQHANVGRLETLVKIKVGERSTVTTQSDMGTSYLLQNGETSRAQCLAVPSPCLHDILWHSDEKDQIALIRMDDMRDVIYD